MKSKLEKLKGTCIGIAGCGGLGSNAAMSLVRAGVGRLILADYDVSRLRISTVNTIFRMISVK